MNLSMTTCCQQFKTDQTWIVMQGKRDARWSSTHPLASAVAGRQVNGTSAMGA
jgi:hypothetical protein